LEIARVVAERTDEAIVSVDAATPETYSKNRGGDWIGCSLICRSLGLEIFRALRTMECHFVVQSTISGRWGLSWISARDLGSTGFILASEELVAFTIGEHTSRTVHRPGHPEHAEFLGILDDERLRRSNVFMSNFGQLSSSGGW